MIGCPSSCDFFAWIQCMRWPGPYDPQERFRGIAVLPKGRASVKGGALAVTGWCRPLRHPSHPRAWGWRAVKSGAGEQGISGSADERVLRGVGGAPILAVHAGGFATEPGAAAPQKPGGSVITVCGNVIVDGMCGRWW